MVFVPELFASINLGGIFKGWGEIVNCKTYLDTCTQTRFRSMTVLLQVA